ncbi:DUF4056 domain-containing protein [Halobacteriovorax sp. HLS]|uniref:DUF4056 domain-containing protein n=1 Tax=Halobacteriovorax sp. HLS TaxID=2234000 RepID=UPI0013E2AEDE|nr:DUF4056 domain-containing protein [Halobacteriovorax sp. HLS]
MRKSLFCFLLCILTGCSSLQWTSDITPDDDSIFNMLNETTSEGQSWNFEVRKNAEFELPDTLRPCCAFGTDHKVQLGALPIPLITLANTVSIEDIGSHSYNASAFTKSSFKQKHRSDKENNGLIYTKRGGFLDMAHVRDTADLTIALFYFFYENLGQEKTVNLRKELGEARIKLKKFDRSKFSKKEIWFLASNLAARKAYQMAVAHEISQWHGYRSIELFDETVSAYSPEDLYSNLLGAKIASNIINNKLAFSSESFNKHMTVWLAKTLQSLEPVSKDETNRLLKEVDGTWWDSSKRLPSKELVIKRNYNLSSNQAPLLVPSVGDEKKAVTIRLSNFLYGMNLDEIANYSFDVDLRYQSSFSHIPKSIWKNGITSDEFSVIVKYDEIEDIKFFKKIKKGH